jgi:sugar phosphate isomerase/epimerase
MLGPRANLAQSGAEAALDFQPGECERFADALGQLRDYAAALGVKLAVKPHGGPTGKAAGLAQLVNTPAAAGVGVFYDPGNLLFYMGQNPEVDLPLVAKNVIGLCVKDHHGPVGAHDFPVPGTGDVNWERVFGILAQENFRGPALVEVLPGADPDEVENNLRAAITYLEEVIARQ